MEDFVMKKLWKKIALGLVALTMASQAHALILIEPYVGYDFSVSGKDSSGNDMDFNGWGYGGRLGLQLAMIMFGVSYDKLDLSLEPGGNWDQTNTGIFVGWNPKGEGIRFWGTYFFSKGGSDDDKGMGYALGLGWKFKPWLALNLEYRGYTFDKPEGDSDKPKLDSLFLTVSFPFDLL
jgi:opacity protein-like surface antigen